MPPTAITPISPSNAYSTSGYAFPLVACDPGNGNSFAAIEGEYFLIAQNSGATPRSLTITSQPDPVFGRTGDVTGNVAANSTRVYRLKNYGWADTNGDITFTGAHTDLLVGVLKIS
jgi:hypothetical protein